MQAQPSLGWEVIANRLRKLEQYLGVTVKCSFAQAEKEECFRLACTPISPADCGAWNNREKRGLSSSGPATKPFSWVQHRETRLEGQNPSPGGRGYTTYVENRRSPSRRTSSFAPSALSLGATNVNRTCPP